MAELSPAAQAVLDAFLAEWDVYAVDDARHAITAALRAAADQVMPLRPKPDEPFAIPPVETMCWMREMKIRKEFITIAAELENHQ